MEKNRSPLTGYLLGALAAASYGTNPLFALPLLNAGIDAFSVLFLRYVFALPMLALIMRRGVGDSVCDAPNCCHL